VRVATELASAEPADVYLLNCSDEKDGCRVAAQQEISVSSKTLTVNKPQAGNWRIVVRSRGQVSDPVTYSVHEALLVAARTPIEDSDAKHASGATRTFALPVKQSDAQYAAFLIAGTADNKEERDALLIAMTALDSDAP